MKKKKMSSLERMFYEEETPKTIKQRNRRIKQRRQERKYQRHKVRFYVLEGIKAIVIALCLALLLNGVFIINSYVPSGSMETTIMTDSRMIGFRFSYWFSEPKRGDIIIFKFPDDETQTFVKRIIGLPGETITIESGVVYVDGVALEEDYLSVVPSNRDYGPYVVPDGCYFVLGDNRNNSVDSRYWSNTYVSEDQIIAKAIFVYWPISEIKLLE